MKSHIIFQTVDDLGIKNENDIYPIVKNLNQTDIKTILDRMEDWYRQQEVPSVKQGLFDFWIPSSNSISLNSITANLLFANSIVMNDPLYDVLCFTEDSSAAKWVFNEHLAFGKHTCEDCYQSLIQIEKKELNKQISDVIAFYLRNKDLINANMLIPYVDVTTNYPLNLPFVDLFRTHDDAVSSFYHQRERHLHKLNILISKEQHVVNSYTLPMLEEWISLEHQKRSSLAGMLQFLLTGSDRAPSIDFLDTLNFGVLNGLIKLLGESARTIGWVEKVPFNSYSLELPTLTGLNSDSLLEILDRDKDSLQQFKEFIVSKTSAISSPYLSPDWQAQMSGLRADINKEVLEIERTFKDIRKDYLKKQAENIVLMAFSISLASLSIMSGTVNPTSVIQGIASGAGLTSSVKSLIDSLLEYQSNVNEQKRKDVFFLWKLSKHKTRD